MQRVNIAEAKARLSGLLRVVRAGEAVVICDRNIPVAELRRIEARSAVKRPLGPARAGFEIPAAFFEAMPDDFELERGGFP